MNGSPRPAVYARSRIAPWPTVAEEDARPRIPPRITPMHGVHPIAKIAPRPKLASHPPRLLTSRPPSRSPSPGPAAGCPMYAGTSGRTQGLRKLSRPAATATRIVRLSALIGPRLPRHSHEASVEDIVQEATELEGRRCELEPAPTELDDRDRGEEPSLPRRIARDVSLVEGRDPLPARCTVLEQTLDDGARLVAELASVA